MPKLVGSGSVALAPHVAVHKQLRQLPTGLGLGTSRLLVLLLLLFILFLLLQYITLHTAFYYQKGSPYIIWCRVMLPYHAMPCHVMSCRATSCYFMLRHVMSSFTVLGYTLLVLISYYIKQCYFVE